MYLVQGLGLVLGLVQEQELVLMVKIRIDKCPYLCNRASNLKTKVTFFSVTLKVDERKVIKGWAWLGYNLLLRVK